MPTSRAPEDRDGDQSTDGQHTAHTDTEPDTDTDASTGADADAASGADTASGTTTGDPGDGLREYCPRCGAATPHAVRIEVQASSDAKYSRQPHRISRCRECDRTVEARVGY